MALFGLKLTRIMPPSNFPKFACDKHGDADIACVQYGTGIEASNITEHMFCGRCFAEDVSRAFPLRDLSKPNPADEAVPKIPLKTKVA